MNLSVRCSIAKSMKYVIETAIVCSMLLVLPSCCIPPLRQAQPGPPLPAAFPAGFPGANNLDSSAQLAINEFFNDPLLISLIDQALTTNQELRMLNEEVQIARNEILLRRGAYCPFVTFGADVGVDKPSLFTPLGAAEDQLEYLPGKHFPDPLPNYMLTLNLFWQLDIWRELRNARDAAIQRYLAASERRNSFVIRLVADIAENYYELMALDKRLENLNIIIKLQEQSLEVAKARKEAGRDTELAVQRFQAEVRKNQSEKLIVTQGIIEAENRINFLAGRFPQPVERDSGDFIDLTIHTLSVGVPAQLLLNRPDIRQAERELVAAGLDVKVARAHFFPRVDITGGVGYQAFDLKYLFWTPEALIYNIAGHLVAPLINKKAIQAEYLSANARQLESVYNYQRVVLNAFTEVVNRMYMVENYSKSIAIKKQQVQSLEAAVEAASKLFQAARPGIDYMDVLFAQRDLWQARLELIDTKQQQLTGIVNVYQALGGGLPPIFTAETADFCKKTTGACGPQLPQPGPSLDQPAQGGGDRGAGEQLPSPRKLPGSDKPPEQLPGPRMLPESDKVPKPGNLSEPAPEPDLLPPADDRPVLKLE
jgi:multidrug efflux system outer membrane protein